AEHDLLESTRGFASRVLHAEPFFVTAAKAGRKVVVLSSTQSYPPEPHLAALRRAGVPQEDFSSFSGFEHRIADGMMHDATALRSAGSAWDDVERLGEAFELQFRIAESSFHGLVFDDPGAPVDGLDSLLLRQEETQRETLLRPHQASDAADGWSGSFRIPAGEREGNTFFRLFDLAPDGSRLALYQRTVSALDGAHTEERLAAYREAYAGFHDPAAALYRDGRLGRPIPLGGDGTAEERYLELAAFDAKQLEGGTRFALETWQPDVLLHYTSITDDAGHLWIGLLDPANPEYDPQVAARIWPYYTRIYQQLDDWLGSILRHARPDAIIAVVSDHGMSGSQRYVYLNRVLQEAGLLTYTSGSKIDLTRTQILAAESAFFLRVNSRDRKGGIVSADERPQVLDAAEAALLAVTDPRSGRRVFTRIFRPEDSPERGIDGPSSGDLYFDLAPGFYPKKGFADATLTPSQWPWGEGTHGFWPERRDMHAIFYATGYGLKQGHLAPPMRHIDVAPTLARLAGFPAPPEATGEVIEGMMVEP
ncbi:MAG: alkaline phosphatase family protein, partial [Acidobacteriota bacterium]